MPFFISFFETILLLPFTSEYIVFEEKSEADCNLATIMIELQNRIRQLEEENKVLRDELNTLYSTHQIALSYQESQQATQKNIKKVRCALEQYSSELHLVTRLFHPT